MTSIRRDDAAELADLEQVIANGLRTFVEVGQALQSIRDRKLYADDHKTFEAYCRERWGFTRRHAYRLIEGAAAAENVTHGTHNLPAPNERQARELAKLPPEKQPEVWAKAVETAPEGKVTAKHVASVVAEESAPEQEPENEPVSAVFDAPVANDPQSTRPASVPEKCAECGVSLNIGCVCDQQSDPEVATESAVMVSVATLTALAKQRDADPEFSSLRATQRAVQKAMPSRAQRMVNFILDGGELALIRLGLDWTVTSESLRRAYRTESLRSHPDRGGSQQGFVALNQAHELIKAMLGEP